MNNETIICLICLLVYALSRLIYARSKVNKKLTVVLYENGGALQAKFTLDLGKVEDGDQKEYAHALDRLKYIFVYHESWDQNILKFLWVSYIIEALGKGYSNYARGNPALMKSALETEIHHSHE